MSEKIDPINLLLTDRGKKWFEQFDFKDKETAERMISSLTLISHSEFSRAVQRLLEFEVSKNNESIAFYSVRELNRNKDFFEQTCDIKSRKVQSLSFGSDHGSEAIIANLIRNFCKTDKNRLLNHPNLDQMRTQKCRTIIFVDDFIGSGNRMCDFLRSFWNHTTIKSWHSFKYIKFVVIAYSGTDSGIKNVENHKINPVVIYERHCPSFSDMPWRSKYKSEMIDFFHEYGKKTCKKQTPLGYDSTMASIVFEHGCPNNVPPILWAPDHKRAPWVALFPCRSVLSAEKSVFPPEITRRDSRVTLVSIGQKKIAISGALLRRGETGETILLILALIAQGQRKQTTLSYATGLNKEMCAKIIDKCIKWGFITQTKRLTETGSSELQAAKKQRKNYKLKLPDRGEDYYYPKLLRGTAYG